ncbi:MAG: chaperonin GroEL [Candidatus Harrisonbacteria bacterium CG10_big_fil_rev_8_21_14_0_10_45_28]|uniref:Chaperonin GroEL n=1 Tax=Candidatus Harrisonbacteria bacterium CG10_big_fil_rev_8_21_14_0_10_45_28 TaxID=1974586 RepID=A0A2H0UNG9_9BACT|nr:MAG: chaperonin GroEL [Candidatus Harrisonbacteria bacterium CG10_big_fil_rev_8_21_14_0_10_45_28]
MAKQILFNDDARSAIRKGIDKLAEAVKMTLGPRGRAVLIEKSYGAPQVTFDGVTVAKEIELEDRFENLGADFIKQAADKTNDNVGDGTTTSVVLAHALIDQGERTIQERGYNVIHLAEELNKHTASVIKHLETQSEPINENQKIKEVATLSAKDAKVGELIATVMDKLGKEAVVSIEDSNVVESSFEIVEGMQFEKGYISQYMISDATRMEAVLENPYILVTDKKISAIKDILPLLEKVAESGKKDMVIISEDLDGEALATLIVNKIRGTFNVLGVKAPGFGDRKKEMLADIAAVTGATFITEEVGKNLENATIEDLGHAGKVTATKDNTIIVGGKGEKSAIQARVDQIKNQIENSDSDFDKEKLKERLGKLTGGVAILKVGGATETAQKELKQRVEDAVSATRAAMEEGIVPGGGMALFNTVGKIKPADQDGISDSALAILENALRSPVAAIIANSGEDSKKIIAKLTELKTQGNEWIGFNALTNEIKNLKESGIIDPLKVTKTALLNAVSVASNYLMTGVAMTDIPEEKKSDPSAGMGGMGGGMGMM